MNCHGIEELLARTDPFTSEAQNHLIGCSGCRSLVEVLRESENWIGPDSARTPFDRLPPLNPVRPLSSDLTLTLLTLGAFLIFCLAIAALVGMKGYLAMTPVERIIYCGIDAVFGLLFSMVAVQVAIPGAKVRVNAVAVAVGSFAVLALVVSALFPDFSLVGFVHRGIPCLRLGCLCAALFGLLAAAALRRGLITNLAAALPLLGCFAGLTGVAVLTLHCPLQNAAHIIVWHLGAIAVSALGGAVLGRFLRRAA